MSHDDQVFHNVWLYFKKCCQFAYFEPNFVSDDSEKKNILNVVNVQMYNYALKFSILITI